MTDDLRGEPLSMQSAQPLEYEERDLYDMRGALDTAWRYSQMIEDGQVAAAIRNLVLSMASLLDHLERNAPGSLHNKPPSGWDY